MDVTFTFVMHYSLFQHYDLFSRVGWAEMTVLNVHEAPTWSMLLSSRESLAVIAWWHRNTDGTRASAILFAGNRCAHSQI